MKRYSSYRKQNGVIRKFFGLIKYFLVLYALYILITSLFVSSYIMQSSAMEDSIPRGQRLLAAPVVFGTELPGGIKIPGIRTPSRGDIVIFSERKISFPLRAADSIIRFFTFQKVSVLENGKSWNNTVSAGRIIGIPGDTVKMENFEAFIKPADDTVFYPEKRIIGKKYSLKKGTLPSGWDKDKPFSGHMEPLTLSDNEYFILNDNRTVTGDSRFSGLVSREDIKAPVFLAYMPGFSFK